MDAAIITTTCAHSPDDVCNSVHDSIITMDDFVTSTSSYTRTSSVHTVIWIDTNQVDMNETVISLPSPHRADNDCNYVHCRTVALDESHSTKGQRQ